MKSRVVVALFFGREGYLSLTSGGSGERRKKERKKERKVLLVMRDGRGRGG